MVNKYTPQKLVTDARSSFAVDPHLNKEYRVRFDTHFRNRYESRKETQSDLDLVMAPFLKALGFYPHHCVRGLSLETLDETLDSLFTFVLYYRTYSDQSYTKPEIHLAKELAQSTFAFDYGYDITSAYVEKEKVIINNFPINMYRVKELSRLSYTTIAYRFDEYVTCSPITAINWKSIEALHDNLNERKRGLSAALFKITHKDLQSTDVDNRLNQTSKVIEMLCGN